MKPTYTMLLSAILAIVSFLPCLSQDRETGSAQAVFVDSTEYNTLLIPASTSHRLGWNWGLPMSRVSDAVAARTMHYAYGASLTQNNALTLAGLLFRDSTTTSTTDTVFLFPHIRSNNISIDGALGAEEYKCLRFDPEITVQKKNFTKNLTASPGATFGFLTRHADVGISGTRVTLDDGDFSADDTTLLLSNIWPDSAMSTRFGKQELRTAHDSDDLQSGLNMLFSVNLRRATGAPTTQDTMAVLILRVRYTLYSGTTGYLTMNQFANPDSARLMNASDATYGSRYAESDSTTGPGRDQFVIRRHHLPASTDNINLSARATFPEVFDPLTSQNPVLNSLYAPKTGTFIRRLDLEVSYVTHASSADNLDVEIDAFKIETPRARDFLSGLDSARFVNQHIRFLRELDTVNTLTNRIYRIASWYAKDEAMMMYWEGWRQYNNLVDSLSLTEINLDYANHLLHKTGTRRLWQGHSPKFTPQTSAPYIELGSSTISNPTAQTRFDFLGFEHGTFHQMYNGSRTHETAGTNSYAVDYETFWGTKDVGVSSYSVELPIPDAEYGIRVCSEDYLEAQTALSVQCSIEGWYYRYAVNPEFLFLGTSTPWYANLWPNSEWKRDQGSSGIVNTASRPSTGSEVLAMAYGQLVLGAKGLLTYYAVSGNNTSNQFYPDYTKSGENIPVGATSFLNRSIEPSGTGYDLMRNDSLGPDFFLPNPSDEPTQVTGFMMHPGSPTTADPAYFAGKLGVTHDRLYAGRESNRVALYRAYTHANHIGGTLQGLELQAWWAKGYKQWTRDNGSFDIDDYLRLDTNLMVAHPSRVDVYGQMDREDYDSVFVDIAVHKHVDTLLTTKFFVAVANRRTDPRVWYNGEWRFFTEAEFEDSLAANAFEEFDQKGAREIRIPFDYHHPSGAAYNLRVTELTPAGVTGIDTVIGANVSLTLRFRPGYGKFLRVVPVPAVEQSGTGFLSHSNQRKLIAFPKVDTLVTVEDTVDGREYLRIVIGDTMWYHQVYHRRRPTPMPTPTAEGGPLSVYYRRSLPIRTPEANAAGTQFVFDASTVTWEPEQLISTRILYDPPGGVDSLIEFDLSCGYPALVVRPAQTDTGITSQVYVVFGCEYSQTEPLDTVLVCETVLPAESSHTSQLAYYTANPARVLDSTPAPVAPVLEHWGTPMINASQHGNFYCWSHATAGIGAGFKVPTARTFAAAQMMYIKARAGDEPPAWYETHPSLNSYSRLHIGEEDCALVWQEGNAPDEGPFIFYTRLRHGGAPLYAIGNYMTTTDPYYNVTGATFTDAYNVRNDIGMVTDGYNVVNEDEILSVHAFPVVYRHLSDWETTPANSRHNLRLVNHKADRIYWQARDWQTPGPWMVARRVVDVSEWSHYTGNGLDEVYSMPEHFIFSAEKNLRGPDATQGEQWSEPGAVVENLSPNYDDSCAVLNFWSDTSATDANPSIWHMVFGWSFYGSTVDHDHADLVSDGRLQQLHGNGRYPHLAARYSVSAHRGYQRSRRVYDAPGGTWPNYVAAPPMLTSSEYFYKPIVGEDEPKALVYSGYRGQGRSSGVGPILMQDTKELVPLLAESDEKANDDLVEVSPDRFVSAWLTIADVADLTFATIADGSKAAGVLFVERESDGERLKLDILNPDRVEKIRRTTYTALGSTTDRFRFVLEPSDDLALGVMDVEIVMPEVVGLRKNAPAQFAGILDLRTMSDAKSIVGQVMVYPNPASDMTTIVFDLRGKNERGAPNTTSATVAIYDTHGVEMGRVKSQTVDAVHVNTSTWPSGIYSVRVLSENDVVHTAMFTVVR